MSKDNKKELIKKPNLNVNILLKINSLKEHGREEITTKKELEKYPTGSLIAYLNNNNILKDGGYIHKFGDEWFIYIASDFSQKYRVRYKNIQKMWVGDVYHTINDIVSLSEHTQPKTNYPVKIGNIVVYYAKTSTKMKRFKLSNKYQRMVKWYETFGDQNNDIK